MGREESRQNCIIISIVIVLSLIFLCMYGIQGIFGFSLFPDEFGYWAIAAKLLGYDFEEITSMGSFYSFGYSLILTPIMFFFSDSVAAYRAAVIVNLCIQILSFILMIRILERLFINSCRELKVLLAGMAVLYPSWVFYTQMTMAEALLFFMYTLVVYLMLLFLERPTFLKGFILALATVYTYSVHMRTVGIVIAVFITVIISILPRIQNNKESVKKELFIICATVLLLLIGFIICINIKDSIIELLYTSGANDHTSINDYSGQTGKLRMLFSFDGIGRFLFSMCGKILYLGCATFGTAYIGIYALVKRTLKKDIGAFFILLSSFMQFMVMCTYLIRSSDPQAVRYDLFLHGRYFDFAVPLLMVFGVYELINEEGCVKKTIASTSLIVISGIISAVVAGLNTAGFSDPHGTLMIGMSYFLDEENVKPVLTIWLNIVFSVLIACIMLLVVAFFKKKNNIFIFCVIHILLIGLSYHACNHFIYIGQSYIFGDIQVADEIAELRSRGHDGDIVLLYEGGLEYIDTVQLRLRDEHIHVIYTDSDSVLRDLDEDNLVLVDFNSEMNQDLLGIYDSSWESGHFDLYYNNVGGGK